jgi:hypothetical protein
VPGCSIWPRHTVLYARAIRSALQANSADAAFAILTFVDAWGAAMLEPKFQRRCWAAFVLVCCLLVGGIIRMNQRTAPSASVAATLQNQPVRAARSVAAPRARKKADVVFRQGLMTRSVVGQVQAASGRPLLGAHVCTLERAEHCCAPPRCQATDDDGRFALLDVPSEHQLFVASAADHVSRMYELSGVLRSPDSEAFVVTLAVGGAEFEGNVVDAFGGPVPGALVTLSPTAEPSSLTISVTDIEGRFRASVHEGDVDVIARAEAYSQAYRRAHAPSRQVTLVLAPSAEIIGRVVDTSTSGAVAGVQLTARSIHLDDTQWPDVSVSDSNGEFRISGLAGGGWYQVMAKSERWRSAEHWVDVELGQRSKAVLLRVSPATLLTGTVTREGEPCPDPVVTATGPVSETAQRTAGGSVRFEGLLPGNYQIGVYCSEALPRREEIKIGSEPVSREWGLSRGLAINGRVEGSRGEPLPNVVVSVVPMDDHVDVTGGNCTTVTTGEFSCSGLRPGRYESYIADTANREVVQVSLDEGTPAPSVVLRMPPSGTIRASIVPNVGATVGGFTVFARSDDGYVMEGAIRQNRHVFERLPLGRYEVYAELPAAAVPSIAQLTNDGQVLDVAITAPPSMTIKGRVVDEQGEPIAAAWVSAVPSEFMARPSSATYPPTVTDEQGEFAMLGLAPGRFDLHARNASGAGELGSVVAGSEGAVVPFQTQAKFTAQ